jgi:hypothetical protein
MSFNGFVGQRLTPYLAVSVHTMLEFSSGNGKRRLFSSLAILNMPKEYIRLQTYIRVLRDGVIAGFRDSAT